MKIKVPDYFEKFRCIADKCLDSCCVGWEIVIDEEAKAKYDALQCEIGREISAKTQHGCFPLSENGRCAFLDEEGLCRIIRTLGEGYLCDICREHPRYYGVGKEGIEGGIGLGCEEAARIILGAGGDVDFTYTERDVKYFSKDEYSDISNRIRELIYGGIRKLDVGMLIIFLKELAPYADEINFSAVSGLEADIAPEFSYSSSIDEISDMLSRFFDILSECEALTTDWYDTVSAAKKVKISELIAYETEFKGLVFYFTHRYVRECIEDMSLGQRIMFALLSALSAVAISCALPTDDDGVRGAVIYSKNVEYSTDNVDMILDMLSDFL